MPELGPVVSQVCFYPKILFRVKYCILTCGLRGYS